MVIVLALIVILVLLVVVAFNAWLLSYAVPILLAEPTNWWAWAIVVLVIVMLFNTGAGLFSKNK
jgi:hypothetical protein